MNRKINDDVILLGQQCAVQICGDPSEVRSIRDHPTALAAIREALRLGEQRNDECNEMQRKYDHARVTIAFFASVIKSGEQWSDQCEKHFHDVFPHLAVRKNERSD